MSLTDLFKRFENQWFLRKSVRSCLHAVEIQNGRTNTRSAALKKKGMALQKIYLEL